MITGYVRDLEWSLDDIRRMKNLARTKGLVLLVRFLGLLEMPAAERPLGRAAEAFGRIKLPRDAFRGYLLSHVWTQEESDRLFVLLSESHNKSQVNIQALRIFTDIQYGILMDTTTVSARSSKPRANDLATVASLTTPPTDKPIDW